MNLKTVVCLWIKHLKDSTSNRQSLMRHEHVRRGKYVGVVSEWEIWMKIKFKFPLSTNNTSSEWKINQRIFFPNESVENKEPIFEPRKYEKYDTTKNNAACFAVEASLLHVMCPWKFAYNVKLPFCWAQ